MNKTSPIKSLSWDDDEFFAGCGNSRLATVSLGRFALEYRIDAEGHARTVIYAQAALRRAFARSRRAGGGARGLCSEFLREGEFRPVPEDSTVGDALAIGAGLR